ncbi:MAG: 4Fe-4S dicluster domain-containing protein [Candidatus Zixiibacteriota bacterium]
MTAQNKYPLAARFSLDPDRFQQLLDSLIAQKYAVFGPTVGQNAVTYSQITSIQQMPIGWSDEQNGGHYRLSKSSRPALFDYVVGQHSWKHVLYPAFGKLWSATKNERGFEVKAPSENGKPKVALLGVRPCELKALAIHDQILTGGEFEDPFYRKIRSEALIIAVNCARPGGTCFCASVGTGPKAYAGFDLALTEVFHDGTHGLIVEIGSKRGEKLAAGLDLPPATEAETAAAQQTSDQAAKAMGRRLDTNQLKERLYANFDNTNWDKIAERCLTCGNCTMVCPTCFCVNIQDTTDLTGTQAERERRWDSCYSVNFSYIHGGSIRTSPYARYRQWLMHKLAYWQDQFGVIGCVGCGRCITWCPVGIDITEEAAVLTTEDRHTRH